MCGHLVTLVVVVAVAFTIAVAAADLNVPTVVALFCFIALNSYVKQHINDIVKLPVDLNCLSSPMLKKLASLFTVQVSPTPANSCSTQLRNFICAGAGGCG